VSLFGSASFACTSAHICCAGDDSLQEACANRPSFAGDANDDFIVELAHKTMHMRSDRDARHRLRTLRSEFRLRHVLTGCYLFSHKVKLPEWGFDQQEVSLLSSLR
jgi:dolichyl-phosphate-mannose--protein O-mannosyl transferase